MASVLPDDLKVALASALVKARSNHSAAFKHWKKKALRFQAVLKKIRNINLEYLRVLFISAKVRKKELQILRKELQEAQCGSALSGILPLHGVCKCTFFEGGERILEQTLADVHEGDIDQLLCRQFLKNLSRWKYDKDDQMKGILMGASLDMDLVNQLSVSCKFLAHLIGQMNQDVIESGLFSSYAHQAIEFLQCTLCKISRHHKHEKATAERMISTLLSQLLQMLQNFKLDQDLDMRCIANGQTWIMQILSKLGSVPFLGQRLLVMASNQASLISEYLCVVDPFHKNVAQLHDNIMFIMQLIESLVLYHSSVWKLHNDDFDESLLEDWIHACTKLRNNCTILSKTNSLLLTYTERISSQALSLST